MIRLPKYARVSYGLLFLASGLYASLLLLTAAMGGQNLRNTLTCACVIIFIIRAFFVTRDSFRRAAAPTERITPRPSSVLLTLGDLVVLTSLILTAYVFLSSKDRLDSPTAPLGVGISIGYLFYLVAVPMRLAGK